ncbi:MAG: MMPL family transporter [Myxococcota bacterium]
MFFGASSFEKLGRRMAAAPRSAVFGLCALTAALAPGVIRVDARAPRPAAESALFVLDCDAGVWSDECLAAIDSLSRVLGEQRSLVASVDSLSTRPRLVAAGDRLELRPLLAELPADPLALRRLRALVSADHASLRGLVAANERAALIQARLVPGTSARDAHALIESLRARFDRPPAISFSAVSGAHQLRELALASQRDVWRETPGALAGLALLAALAFGSLRTGLWLGALGGAALIACSGALGFGGAGSGAGAAAVPALVSLCAASTGFALLHRIRSELRAGCALDDSVARALGSVGGPVCAAGCVGALAFLSLVVADRSAARELALAGAGSVCGAVLLVGLGLPAALLAFHRGRAGALALQSSSPLSALLESGLGWLDGALRGRRAARGRRILVSAALAALAAWGARDLRGDASAARFSPAASPARDGGEALAREFGGSALLRVTIDSGVSGGAAEPLFLERVLDFERAAAGQPGVAFARSLVDTAVLPAMRATHDGDPGFSVVPPTRPQVEEAYGVLAREAPARLADGLDTEVRHLAIDLLAETRDPRAVAELARALESEAAARFARAGALSLESAEFAEARESERLRTSAALAAALAIAISAAVIALALDSAVAGLLAALPAALGVFAVFGAMGGLGLPLDALTCALSALVVSAAAGPALLYLARVRELGRAGAELGVAVSLALRDVGRPIGGGALASFFFCALSASAIPPVRAFGVLACAAILCSVGGVLVVLPPLIRTLRPNFLIHRTSSATDQTPSCARGANNGGA